MPDPAAPELAVEIADLRRFIDRRFSELSAEIHATVQMVDFSESNLTGQLAAMREQIAAVLAVPAASSRNSGVELEAVVQATEAAANRIMEAAEAIGDWLREGPDDAGLRARLNAIFEACSFQDLTSQRIRRAIEHLHRVEAMLGSLAPAAPAGPAAGHDLAQAEIDRMLTG